jgi:hypothetical protein
MKNLKDVAMMKPIILWVIPKSIKTDFNSIGFAPSYLGGKNSMVYFLKSRLTKMSFASGRRAEELFRILVNAVLSNAPDSEALCASALEEVKTLDTFGLGGSAVADLENELVSDYLSLSPENWKEELVWPPRPELVIPRESLAKETFGSWSW